MDEALSADLDKLRGKLDGWPELVPLQIPASMMRRLLEALSVYALRESQNGDSKALNTITRLLNDPDDFTLEWVMLQIVAVLKTTGRIVDFGASREEWIKQHTEQPGDPLLWPMGRPMAPGGAHTFEESGLCRICIQPRSSSLHVDF